MLPKYFQFHYLAFSIGVMSIGLAFADDTEIFFKKNDDNQLRSNVLLLLDTSGSMVKMTEVPIDYESKFKIKAHTPENGKLMRLEVVQDVASNLVETTNGINISLSRFDAGHTVFKGGRYRTVHEGGYVDLPFINSGNRSNKNRFINAINKYKPEGNTPLTESMYEMFMYYSGGQIVYGNDTKPGKSHSESRIGNRYNNSIENECQYNNLVLFSDGQPTADESSNKSIRRLLSGMSLPQGLNNSCGTDKDEIPTNKYYPYSQYPYSGKCLDELAWYMKNKDMADHIPGKQTVSTYTIGGFGGLTDDAVDLMKSTAKHGGGKYYSADDVEGLQKALDDIISRVLDINTSFVTPAVTVDAFNRLENSDEIYYTLFKPDKGPRWSGNLKRYRIDENNTVVDVNGKPALNANDGAFSKNSQSYWSKNKDGADVLKGGMVSQIKLNRKLYTYTGPNLPSDIDLSSANNHFHEDNSNLTFELLGEKNDIHREEIIQWGRGVDIDDLDQDGDNQDINQRIGDPLHTAPKIINYYSDPVNKIKDTTVFFTTNEGFLHAINAETGHELFSFIPQELLPNVAAYRRNETKANESKLYGLDGPIGLWHKDLNGDNDLLSAKNGSVDTNEHLYLFLTMRRGGNNIYGLDVTSRQSPILKWAIKGDLDQDGNADDEGDFRELGQTWSKPTIANVKWRSEKEPKTVLFFTGGYDPSQDKKSGMESDRIGRAIYMVDPETGKKLWEASAQSSANEQLAEMKYSFPANISLIDIDSDGLVDYFYAIDISGQVWRFDIKQDNNGANDFAKGYLLAKLKESTGGKVRRFYSAVDPSLVQKRGANNSYIALSVGSGFRAHPLDKTNADRFYMVKDYNPFGPIDSSSLVTITENDLYDATENLIQDGLDDVTKQEELAKLNTAKGWFIKLENEGEKVLGESTTYAGVLLFTTHQPTSSIQTNDPCKPSAGTGLLYAINLQDGTAVVPTGNSNEPQKKNRHFRLKNGGIPGTPGVIQKNGKPVVAIGTEVNRDVLAGRDTLYKTFWREE